MNFKKINSTFILLIALATTACAAQATKQPSKLETTLLNMTKAAKQLKSFETQITHTIIQDPELFESSTTNKGKIWYLKNQERSYLRLSFTSRQEDDFEPENYHEEYIFDGFWMTRINYQLKQISMDQFAKLEAKPIDVFELISANMPLIGFRDAKTLNKDFEIELIDTKNTEPIKLVLDVKKSSKYYEKYTQMELHIDRKLYLPNQIISKTSEGDTYEISLDLTKESFEKTLESKLFEIPQLKGFDKTVKELKPKTTNQEKN